MDQKQPLTQTVSINNRDFTFQTGKLARHAGGSVTVQYGDSIVLVAATAAEKPREGTDFFPLTVDYREKAAAAGKFPGGYFKREGRPTEKEILTSRMIDRPVRVLFPETFRNEVQIISILLSSDMENDPDILAINGASAALTLSDIPFDGPIGAVRVARTGGQFVANPTHAQIKESDLDLVYVGTETDMIMIEGSANEISEADFYASMEFAHTIVRQLVLAQKEMAAKLGVTKRQFVTADLPKELVDKSRAIIGSKFPSALYIHGKAERHDALVALRKELTDKLVAENPDNAKAPIGEIFYTLQAEVMRATVIREGKRMDGRGERDIRPIHGEVGLLPRVHGSAVFQRGETQALALVTLGSTADVQEMDVYGGGVGEKKFILHYNFPPFSTGETKRIMGPGRREIGHGALAERSLLPSIPTQDFPYTLRVTSEILESNGSSSMATVCAGTLALMDAGVPIKSPVAGISIGLVKEGEKAVLLTDILGAEDGMGDMDFKVAGTRNGITGFQVDLKIRGLSFPLIKETLERAREARHTILDKMAAVLPESRKEMSRFAPRILTVRIPPDKIGALIGPGGKNINKITAETGVEIDIQDSGEVFVFSSNGEASTRAVEMIQALTAEAELGKIYRGKVADIKEFGCFVEFMPGKDGMVHISELAGFRVGKVEDICKVGDEMWVKVIEIDDRGRVRLSRRAALEEKDAIARGEPIPEYKPKPRESFGDRGGRGGRPERREGGGYGRGGGREGGNREGGESRGPRPAHGTPAALVGGDRGPRREGGYGGRGGENRGGGRESQ